MGDRQEFERLREGHWREVFQDGGTGDWREKWFLDGRVARVTNGEGGMLFEAGDTFLEESHHGVLWTDREFGGDLKMEYEFTRMDREKRCVNILYIQARGSGEAPYGQDVKEWRRLREVPLMRWYYEGMNTYHISYAAFDHDRDGAPGYIRCRRYMAGPLEGTEIAPDYDPEDFFASGVPHKITLIKKGQVLYFHISNGEKEKLCRWVNDRFPPIHWGRIGLRQMFTRRSLYRNIRISQA